MGDLRIDIRLLIGTGVLCAFACIFVENDKAFTVLSTTSSALIGAGVGILKESTDDIIKEEEY